MALLGYRVVRVARGEVSAFIEQHHYSGSINGCIADFCYALLNTEGVMVGALFFGRMAMRNQYARFADAEEKVLELRRLVCVDATPKNAESFLIGRALRLLSKDWRRDGVVVSYADAEHGHVGTVYRASNFEYHGFRKGSPVIVDSTGKRYHDKAIRTKSNGVLKPFAQRLKNELESGAATYKDTAGKHCFIYRMR